MRQNKPYLYAVLPDKVLRFWNGTGWSTGRKQARRFQTEAEAEDVLRQMLREGIHVKMGWLS